MTTIDVIDRRFSRKEKPIPEKSRPHPLVELYGEFPDRLRGDRWQPSADVFETEAEVVVRFEVAGVRVRISE